MKKELLEKIYNQLDYETKKELEKEYPDLNKKPFDAWYVYSLNKEVLKFNMKDRFYGIDMYKNWCAKKINNFIGNYETLATKEQILERLIPEAKRRGLFDINNITFKCLHSESIWKIGDYINKGNKYELDCDNTELLLDGVTILKDGVWAEVIEENTKNIVKTAKKEDLLAKLKYRAFVRNSFIVDVVSINFSDEFITWDYNQYDGSVPPNKCYEVERFNETILLQNTGLFDKNGDEIYEGDILCDYRLDGTYRMYKIFKNKGGFVFNAHQDDFHLPINRILFTEGCSDLQNAGFLETCKIMSNIYTNEELN